MMGIAFERLKLADPSLPLKRHLVAMMGIAFERLKPVAIPTTSLPVHPCRNDGDRV